MFPTDIPHRPGDRRRGPRDVARLLERAESLANVSLPEGTVGPEGLTVAPPPRERFIARITGGGGSGGRAFSWVEQREPGDGTLEDDPAGRAGEAGYFPAYEINGLGAPEGTYVELWPAAGGLHYWFSRGAGGGGLTTCREPVVSVYCVDGDIEYVTESQVFEDGLLVEVGEGCPEDPGGGTSGASGGGGCVTGGGAEPAEISTTIAGVQAGSCAFCENVNRDYLLLPTGTPCEWQWADEVAVCGGGTLTLTLTGTASGWVLEIQHGTGPGVGAVIATYSTAAAWDGASPLVLDAGAAGGACTNWPPTLTLTPGP